MTNQRFRAELDYDQLIYVISHDLKAPSRALNQYLFMLKDSLTNGSQDDVDRIMGRMEEVLGRFDQQMEGLLKLSRFGNAKGNAAVIQSADVIHEILEKSGVRFRVDSNLPSVHFDRERFDWIFSELAANVANHAGDNAEISVSHDGNNFIFEDNGIGIDEQKRHEVFMVFRPIHRHDSPHAGLGLACVARIVRSTGGQLAMECPTQGGTRFLFSLPIA